MNLPEKIEKAWREFRADVEAGEIVVFCCVDRHNHEPGCKYAALEAALAGEETDDKKRTLIDTKIAQIETGLDEATSRRGNTPCQICRAVEGCPRDGDMNAPCRLDEPCDVLYMGVERFTERARKVMALADHEAQQLNHEYIGTEHILLGLLKEGSGVGSAVLKNLGVDPVKVRVEIEKCVKPGPETASTGRLPQTPRAKKVLEYTMEEARNLNHNYIGTEHLLLGLLREENGVAAQVLIDLGLKLDEVREEVLKLLGAGNDKPCDVCYGHRVVQKTIWPGSAAEAYVNIPCPKCSSGRSQPEPDGEKEGE